MVANTFFARPHFRKRDGRSIRRRGGSSGYTPLQVAQAYGIPIGQYTGVGVTVGIIELGGTFSQTDFAAFMVNLKLPPNPVTVVSVNGGQQSDDPGGANVEVMMDVEIVAAFAPAAKIRLYFANNTSAQFAAAIQQAYNDGCDIISISWGGPENTWDSASMQAMNAAIQTCASAGVNVFVAAGDNGSGDGESGNNSDFPASSPYSVGCGGTSLVATGSVITSETVWNDGSQGGSTGGGYSSFFSKPSYQSALVQGSYRGVPDVAGVADPETGWLVLADGQQQVVGGTSAVAPMWAGINALLQQANGGKRVGFLNPLFYANESAFRDVINGNDGTWSAAVGWDPCTGLGTPNGPALFALVTGGSTTSPPVTTNPPPVTTNPPPVTTQPPSSPTPTTLQQEIDAIFAEVEQELAGRLILDVIISLFQGYVDGILQGLPASSIQGDGSGTLIVVVQQALKKATVDHPLERTYFLAIAALVLRRLRQRKAVNAFSLVTGPDGSAWATNATPGTQVIETKAVWFVDPSTTFRILY